VSWPGVNAHRLLDGHAILGVGDAGGFFFSLESHMNAPSWREQAACRGAAQEVFFPSRPGKAIVDVEDAKRVCATCPVQPQCLEFALLTRQDFGVWGGTTEQERRVLRKVVLAKARSEPYAVPV
jgi:WhiB family redox-sensing transcriptional regulator